MEYEEDSTFQKQLEGILLNPDHCVASNIKNHLPAWKLYFEHFEHTAQSQQMLTWIEHGFLLNFVSVHSACQVVHPRYKEKVESVTQLLQTTVSKEQVPALLIGNKPSYVSFCQ